MKNIFKTFIKWKKNALQNIKKTASLRCLVYVLKDPWCYAHTLHSSLNIDLISVHIVSDILIRSSFGGSVRCQRDTGHKQDASHHKEKDDKPSHAFILQSPYCRHDAAQIEDGDQVSCERVHGVSANNKRFDWEPSHSQHTKEDDHTKRDWGITDAHLLVQEHRHAIDEEVELGAQCEQQTVLYDESVVPDITFTVYNNVIVIRWRFGLIDTHEYFIMRKIFQTLWVELDFNLQPLRFHAVIASGNRISFLWITCQPRTFIFRGLQSDFKLSQNCVRWANSVK